MPLRIDIASRLTCSYFFPTRNNQGGKAFFSAAKPADQGLLSVVLLVVVEGDIF